MASHFSSWRSVMPDGNTRRERLREMNARAAARIASERAVEIDAIRRVRDGAPGLAHYRQVYGEATAAHVKLWLPTLVVGAARRQLGIGAGLRPRAVVSEFLVADVLSHPPGESLDRGLRSSLAKLDRTIEGGDVRPEDRQEAAWIRLQIGPGEGLSRRLAWWRTKAERRAKREFCDPQCWRNLGLFDAWDEVNSYLHRSWAEQGLEVEPDKHVVTTFAGVAAVLHELA